MSFFFVSQTSLAQVTNPVDVVSDYWQVHAHLRPEERRNHVHYDFKRGFIVSQHGVRQLSHRPLPFYAGAVEGTGETDFTGIAPYRRVRSIEGYSLVEANLTLPLSLTGVSEEGEAAYNYLGIQRETDDVEAGVVSSTVTTPGRWFAHFHIGEMWGPTPAWPVGGIAPGSSVFLRLSVVPPRTIAFYIAYTEPDPSLVPQSRTFTYDSELLDPAGKGQRVRRVTSLLLNNANGSSATNSWSQVKLGVFLAASVLWQQIYTYETTVEFPQYVTVNEIAQHHAESISIEAP